jgi:precorrin-8X/cobalt-precorrin-8 methylmutase
VTVTVAPTCTACGACLVTCPEKALLPAPRRPAVLDHLCTDCLACLEVCPVDAIVPSAPVHPIEEASYRILAERVDLSAWEAGDRDVVARMVHATADESFAATARIGEQAVEAAVTALAAGAPVVCDARMVVAGIPSVPGAVCLLDEVPEAPPGDTRAAAAIHLAAERYPDGALWVIGNAPTALFALLELHAARTVRPAAVIGLPVGYVGAAESKDALWAGPLRPVAITNSGVRGGSPAAAGAVNALARLARARTAST